MNVHACTCTNREHAHSNYIHQCACPRVRHRSAMQTKKNDPRKGCGLQEFSSPTPCLPHLARLLSTSEAMASGFGVITPKGRCYPFWLVRLHASSPASVFVCLTRSNSGFYEVHAR
jgi:hypothetical protein